MFKWFRKKNDDPASREIDQDLEAQELAEDQPPSADEPAAEPEAAPPEAVEDEELAVDSAEVVEPRDPEPDQSVTTEAGGLPETAPEVLEAAVEVPEEALEDAEEPAETAEESVETAEEVEEEERPETRRKGFFARLFGSKPEEEPEAEQDPVDEQAAAADVTVFMETIAAEDEADAARTVAAEAEEAVKPKDVTVEAEEGVEPETVTAEAEEVVKPETVTVDAEEGDTPEAVTVEAEEGDKPETVTVEAEEGDKPEDVTIEAEEGDKPEDVTIEAEEGDKPETVAVEAEEAAEAEDAETSPRKGLFAKFKDRLSATRDRLAGRIETLLSSVRTIDDDVLDELEELLITADLGVKTTTDLLFKIRGQVAASELRDTEALKQALKKRMSEMLNVPVKPMPKATPLVVMVVGINGVGKTTTIAKLTKRLQAEGKKVLLAAGDTFRSAAVEQLTVWAERLGADIVSQPTGSKSSAVVFDAISAAQTRGSDVVIIDTAGRLHTKVNLMDELKKIKRVAGKALEGAPHHTILVLDGNTGQNALLQAQTFNEAVGVDSIIMTKLDGTSKGGVIVSITNELKIPITHVGLGESFDDLQPFDAEAFTEAILSAN